MLKFFEYINYLNENKTVSLNESKKVGKSNQSCNIVFVTKNPKGENSTGEYSRFKESCDKFNVNIYPVDVDKIKYEMKDNGKIIIENIGEFSKNNTIFIFRHAIKIKSPQEEKEITQKNVKIFKKILKSNGFYLSNDSSVSDICKDKFKTYNLLTKNNVDTISTNLIDTKIFEENNLKNVDNLNNYISTLKINFPIIVKVVDGTQGIGIFRCNESETLSSIVQYVIKKEGKCILQPFCDIDYDMRIHVFCKTLKPDTASIDDFITIGSMKREKVKDDFRTNYSLGGNILQYETQKEEQELAKKAAKAIGAVWCGVDLCFDKNTKKYYVIEVNSSPALKGISQVTTINPTDIIVKNIKKTLEKNQKTNDVENRDLVSYYENVKLDGIEIKGCFDTGNSAICALKSNHFVDNGDEIEFEISGQIIKKKVVKRKNILHGGIKSDERPVVHFDITFNEKTLKNVEVCVRGLTDIEKKREKETNKKIGGKKILLSTYVIDKLGLIVHPDRNLKFIKS